MIKQEIITPTNFMKKAVKRMMDMSGNTKAVEALESIPDNWQSMYTITAIQKMEFARWFTKTYRKVFNRTRKQAEIEYLKFNVIYGLKIKKEVEDDQEVGSD